MSYQTVCSECHNVITAYFHTINKPLIEALRQLVDHYSQTVMGANLQSDLKLTKNQYNNFQKLQYFNLAMRVEGKGWFPTQTGIDFICGEVQIPNRVATLNSVVLPEAHLAWGEAKNRPVLISVWDVDETSYKKREEYQKEKSRQLQAL